MNTGADHTTKVEDVTASVGYGPAGHGTWLVSCSCGWRLTTQRNGMNAATLVASDHEEHMNGAHKTRVFACPNCW